jgi:hypothetical protein
MSPENLFLVSNAIALVGWILLLVAPWLPRLADRVAGYGIPVVLALVYATTLVSYMPDAEGSFTSLSGVAAGFAAPSIALVGWLHYLALDLFVGGWESRTARRESIPHWQVVPCLVLTLFAAPIGLTLFLLIRRLHRRNAARPPPA